MRLGMARALALALANGISLFLSNAASAVGTEAGTTIVNTATADYQIGGIPFSETSNPETVVVAEILDVDVTLLTVTPNPGNAVAVVPGSTSQVLTFTLTNTGNGTDTYSLVGLSAPGINPSGSDTFDPTLVAIHFDDGTTPGVFDAGDTRYEPGVNDPTLAADQAITLHVLNDIGAGEIEGARGDSQLTAASLALSLFPAGPAAGDSLPGQGELGGDLVLGVAVGDDDAYGTYVVSSLALDFQKTSVVISDPIRGTSNPLPIPGATLEYTLTVEVLGSATATDLVIADAIPANTTYVPGSMTLDAIALTDPVDPPTDDARFDALGGAHGNGEVSIGLGDQTALAGRRTITFRVTID